MSHIEEIILPVYYGLVTGQRDVSEKYLCTLAGRAKGLSVTCGALPELATLVPLPFPLALDHNSF